MKNKAMVLFGVLGALAAGCSGGASSSADKKNAGSGAGGGSQGDPSSKPNLGVDEAGGAGGTTSPPEQETKVDYLAPRAGERRVYVANPTRNTVTIIDSTTLAISEQPTGDTPIVVATVPGKDLALVVNAGSHTLRVLRQAAACGNRFPIVTKANAVSIAPDGRHAVVWFDSAQSIPGITPSATGSSQEVSVVGLGATCDADTVVAVSVGYHPTSVVFSSDSSAAFVVTDDGISELRFADIKAASIAPFTRIDTGSLALMTPDAGGSQDGGARSGSQAHRLPVDSGDLDADEGADALSESEAGVPAVDAWSADAGVNPPDGQTVQADSAVLPDAASKADGNPSVDLRPADGAPPAPLANGKAVDISVTKAGDYAIARREGSGVLLLVDLKAKTVSTTVLSSEVTDLDLVDGPSGAQAYAVLRAESRLVRLDVPAGFSDPSFRKDWPPFSGGTIGSVTISPNGTYALLYTTATPSKDLAVFDMAREQVLSPSLKIRKIIRAVAFAPDEKTALVLHTRTAPTNSSNPSPEEIDDQSYGYTMVDIATRYAKLFTTDADPGSFVITPDSSNAFVLLRDDKASIRAAQRISLGSLMVTDFPLGSPPNSIAALSPISHKVFVGQVYPEGRISFIDWVTGSVESVTGFALNGRIQQ